MTFVFLGADPSLRNIPTGCKLGLSSSFFARCANRSIPFFRIICIFLKFRILNFKAFSIFFRFCLNSHLRGVCSSRIRLMESVRPV